MGRAVVNDSHARLTYYGIMTRNWIDVDGTPSAFTGQTATDPSFARILVPLIIGTRFSSERYSKIFPRREDGCSVDRPGRRYTNGDQEVQLARPELYYTTAA